MDIFPGRPYLPRENHGRFSEKLLGTLPKTDISKTSCFTFGGRALTYEILV